MNSYEIIHISYSENNKIIEMFFKMNNYKMMLHNYTCQYPIILIKDKNLC